MNGKSAYSIVPPSPAVRAVQDEWGMFDPNQAGLKAAFRAVRELSNPEIADSVLEAADPDDAVELSLQDEAPPAPARHAALDPLLPSAPPITGRAARPEPAVRDNRSAPRTARAVSHVATHDDGVYDLTETETGRRHSKPVDRGAVYSLEFPTRCSQCCSEISSVRVSRLLRTQVSFTSTLPRKGYIIVCPECDGILSAELSGLI
jgi:hypothetical protein